MPSPWSRLGADTTAGSSIDLSLSDSCRVFCVCDRAVVWVAGARLVRGAGRGGARGARAAAGRCESPNARTISNWGAIVCQLPSPALMTKEPGYHLGLRSTSIP